MKQFIGNNLAVVLINYNIAAAHYFFLLDELRWCSLKTCIEHLACRCTFTALTENHLNLYFFSQEPTPACLIASEFWDNGQNGWSQGVWKKSCLFYIKIFGSKSKACMSKFYLWRSKFIKIQKVMKNQKHLKFQRNFLMDARHIESEQQLIQTCKAFCRYRDAWMLYKSAFSCFAYLNHRQKITEWQFIQWKARLVR